MIDAALAPDAAAAPQRTRITAATCGR